MKLPALIVPVTPVSMSRFRNVNGTISNRGALITLALIAWIYVDLPLRCSSPSNCHAAGDYVSTLCIAEMNHDQARNHRILPADGNR
jgi:hypothetical protein